MSGDRRPPDALALPCCPRCGEYVLASCQVCPDCGCGIYREIHRRPSFDPLRLLERRFKVGL